jgi:hypothetical protein
VKVGGTIYLVLYTPRYETSPIYAVGRGLLVLVGRNSITYNEIFGRSVEVPIESRKSVSEPKHLR